MVALRVDKRTKVKAKDAPIDQGDTLLQSSEKGLPPELSGLDSCTFLFFFSLNVVLVWCVHNLCLSHEI